MPMKMRGEGGEGEGLFLVAVSWGVHRKGENGRAVLLLPSLLFTMLAGCAEWIVHTLSRTGKGGNVWALDAQKA